MNFLVDNEFKTICEQIANEDLTIEKWREAESDDACQSVHFCGGYDADEDAFCFSYYGADSREYWFQLTLSEVQKILSGKMSEIEMREVI
jgi:hypothetical protein